MADQVKLNLAGVRALRNSPGVVRRLQQIADDVAEESGRGLEAGPGLDGSGRREPFETDRAATKTRARILVYPATGSALGRNRKHNTLVKTLASRRR